MTQQQKVLNLLKKEIATSDEIEAACRFEKKATAAACLHLLEQSGKAFKVGSFKPNGCGYRVFVWAHYKHKPTVKQNIESGTIDIDGKIYEVHGSWKLGDRLPVYEVLTETGKKRNREAEFIRSNIKSFGLAPSIQDKKFFAMAVLGRKILQNKIPKEKIKSIINSIKKGRTYEAYR